MESDAQPKEQADAGPAPNSTSTGSSQRKKKEERRRSVDLGADSLELGTESEQHSQRQQGRSPRTSSLHLAVVFDPLHQSHQWKGTSSQTEHGEQGRSKRDVPDWYELNDAAKGQPQWLTRRVS